MINKIKSSILTYLFKDWVKNEFDLETLSLTRTMISQRESELKYAIDKANHKPILGYMKHLNNENN